VSDELRHLVARMYRRDYQVQLLHLIHLTQVPRRVAAYDRPLPKVAAYDTVAAQGGGR